MKLAQSQHYEHKRKKREDRLLSFFFFLLPYVLFMFLVVTASQCSYTEEKGKETFSGRRNCTYWQHSEAQQTRSKVKHDIQHLNSDAGTASWSHFQLPTAKAGLTEETGSVRFQDPSASAGGTSLRVLISQWTHWTRLVTGSLVCFMIYWKVFRSC